jgi:dipeptidyl-peptidase-4
VTTSFPRQHARTRRFQLGRPRAFTVGTDVVLFLRSGAGDDPVTDLWLLDLATGSERLLVAARDLLADDGDLPAAERARRERVREQAGGIVGYATDDALTIACFALGGRLRTVDVASGEVREEATEGAVVDPRPSPDGSLIAYAAGDGVHVLVPGGQPTTLVGGEGAGWGLADFIAAEELQRTRGFWWSPDSTQLVVARVDDAPVGTFWIADPANPDQPAREHRYPAAGTANPDVRLALVEIAERRRRDLRWDHDELPYLVDVRWQADAPLAAVLLDRAQRRQVVLGFDPESGAGEVLAEQRDADWVDVVPGSVRWLPDGRLVTVADVRDHGPGGTRTVVVDGQPLGPAGTQVHLLLDARAEHVTVVASVDPLERHVARISLVDGAVEWLTQGAAVTGATVGEAATVLHHAPLAGAPSVAVHTAAGAVHPVRVLTEEPAVEPRPTLLELGPDRLRAALLLPTTPFEGRLPVLLDPYGGPHVQRVLASRNAYLTSQWFADQGWAVLVVDGHGTTGRGPDFERAVRDDFARTLDDQVVALDDLLGRDDRLDGDRVAIRGWSFGGYLAGLAALRRPDRFRAAIIGAPVTDWRLYDTAYTERYLGHPDEQPEVYRASSLVGADGELVDPAPLPEGRPAPGMLIVHGLADDNVVAAHSLRLSSALLAAGRPHEFLPLSGVTHMTPQEVVAENLLHHQLDFLRRHV